MTLTRDRLSTIQAAVGPHLHSTPLVRSQTLSRLTGLDVHLKLELFQKTGSHKPRGMLWALQNLTPAQRAAGVLTFSAGNAAQGLAYAGALQGVPVTVTMPAAASSTKAKAAREYGAEVILHGAPQECLVHTQEICAQRGLTFISSYDDEMLMEGHATLAAEIVEDLPDVAAIADGLAAPGVGARCYVAARAPVRSRS